MTPPIRVLLAEDSTIFAAVMVELFDQTSDIELVKHVDNGEDAVRACQLLKPDLVLMDVQMPRMDGLSATEAIMATCPTPILIITSDPFRGGVDVSFKALSAGALDLFPKTTLSPARPDESSRELLRKIRLLAQIPVIRHVRGSRTSDELVASARGPSLRKASSQHPIVGIVASTGGPRALATILEALPVDLRGSLLIVQHITQGFTSHLARWLDANSAISVREATDRHAPRPGEVLIAPGGHHMELDAAHDIRLRKPESTRRGHCPGGDELLSSLARYAPRRAVGVVLSGMGEDGARGLLSLSELGCATVVQDEQSSVVWGMPGAACDLRAVQHILSPHTIASFLTDYCAYSSRRSR